MTAEADRSVRFEVEVRVDADPISGRVTEAGGAIRDFHGWIDLIRAIEAAVGPNERSAP